MWILQTIISCTLFKIITPQSASDCRLIPRVSGNCDNDERYRSISGVCNNIRHPEWGSINQELNRILPPQYKDGRQEPRGGQKIRSLPNPRYMSQKNHPDEDQPDTRYTHMVMQFGQFLDHDLTLTPKDESLNCCEDPTPNNPKCFTIPIPSRDRFYSWVNLTATCLNFVRSTPVCQRSTRQQLNELTAFVDGSTVYGSHEEHASVLRTYQDGLLAINTLTNQPPTKEQLNLRPNRRLLRPETQEDFVAGDNRVNEHPFLTAMHVVMMREHNRIAEQLRRNLPQYLLNDETLYQESRRIVVAEIQNIVYGEYLPTILGAKYMDKYGLLVTETSKYDSEMDPTIYNEFASAAFRFGHSMINSMFMLVSQRKPRNHNGASTWFWRLREIFDGQKVHGEKLPLEQMIEGLISQMPQTCDAYFSSEVTNHLFQKNHNRENFGNDLLAINVQRGRDHGLPSYNSYRKRCGLAPLTSWSERPSELDEHFWLKLKDVYEKVDDIDLYLGGVSERNVKGGAVGPVFACIIGEQFRRLKYGDRFFYTHKPDNIGSKGLGDVAKSYVLQRTLGDLLCDNTALEGTQKWVTLQPDDSYNPFELCSKKRPLSMKSIATEIADELPRQSRQVFLNRGRTPSRRGRGSRNQRRGKGPLSPVCLGLGCGQV